MGECVQFMRTQVPYYCCHFIFPKKDSGNKPDYNTAAMNKKKCSPKFKVQMHCAFTHKVPVVNSIADENGK